MKNYALLILVLLSAPIFADCDIAQPYYEQAMESKKNKQFKQALAFINKAAAHCQDQSIYYTQGKILFKLGRLDEALASFELANKNRGFNKNANANALARIALVHFKKDEMLKASSFIEQAHELNQQNSPSWLVRLRKDIDFKKAQHIISAGEINTVVGVELASKGAGAVIRVNFNSITFKFNSTELTQSGVEQVNELGKFLVADIKTVTLIGHTDKQGNTDYNMRLSINRAIAVKQRILQQHPKLVGFIQTDGKGESDLRYLGDTEKDHQLNRRVEMRM